MTRQVTDQLYIDLGYFTPEEYYVYIAMAGSNTGSNFTLSAEAEVLQTAIEAEAALSVTSTITATATRIKTAAADIDATANTTADAERLRSTPVALTTTANTTATVAVVRGFAVSMTVSTNVTATISHILGADLFAFGLAAIAAAVDRIRDNNIESSSVFDTAIDYVRQRDVDSDLFSTTDFDLAAQRSRSTPAILEAAFSLAIDYGKIIPLAADIDALAGFAVDTDKITGYAAELVVNSDLSIDYVRQRSSEVDLDTTSALTVDARLFKSTDVNINSDTTVTANIDRLIGPITAVTAFLSALSIEPVKITDTAVALASTAVTTVLPNYNFAPTIDLGVAFDSQVSARISVDPGADLDAVSLISAKLTGQQRFRATFNSSFSLTAINTRVKFLERNFNTGLGLDGVRIDPRPPYTGPFFVAPNLVHSVWYRLDPADTDRLLFKDPDQLTVEIINRTTLRWSRAETAQPILTMSWTGLPNDNEWHHIQINYLTAASFGNGLVSARAFLDGESLGTRSVNIVSGTSTTWGPYLTVRRNTAQIFTGQLTPSQTVNSPFFPYRDQLPTVESLGNKVWYYNSLDAQDNATVTLVPPGAIVPFEGSSQPLMTQTAQAAFRVHVDLIGVITFRITLPPVSATLTATLGGPQRATADLTAATALTATAVRIIEEITADLTSTADLTVEAYEFTKATAELTTTAEVSVLAGKSVDVAADLVSEFALAIEPATTTVVVIDTAAVFALTLDATRIQTTEIALDSALNFDLDIVRIQPGLADLTTTAELSLEITKTAGPVSAELFSEFTLFADIIVAGKVEAEIFSDTALVCTVERIRTGVSQFDALTELEVAERRLRSTVIAITALASQLTIARSLVLSTNTTLIILPETRNLSVLRESRIWHIEPESRTRKILPEPRNIDIEQATRTINIKETS